MELIFVRLSEFLFLFIPKFELIQLVFPQFKKKKTYSRNKHKKNL